MTTMISNFEHETINAKLEASLSEALSEAMHVVADYSDEPTHPAVCVATIMFADPENGAQPASSSSAFEENVRRTVELSTQFLRFMYKELVPQRDDPNAFMQYPWSFSAIDFPGSEDGEPRTSAAPYVNIVMIIPDTQVERVSDFSFRLPTRKFKLKELGVKSVDFVWTDDCVGELGYSLHHLLRFSKGWPPIVHRRDVVATFIREFAHYHVNQ